MTGTLTDLRLDLPRVASGKIREMFDTGDHLLMVATDRISVYDVVLPTPIPDKGAVLTGLSAFWFSRTKAIVPNHMVLWYTGDIPQGWGPDREEIRARAMLVRRAEMLSVECVVRGYLAGSGWKDYRATGSVCGVPLPPGLREAERLPEPIFTPATKATTGHDENVSLEEAAAIVADAGLMRRVVRASIDLYEHGRSYAESKGIVLADTKFEFGLVDGELTLCDEALTPDSSRYWPADAWEPGRTPPSFDKQFVRDYADSIGWGHSAPGPELPRDVVKGTRTRYREAFERLTGSTLTEALAKT